MKIITVNLPVKDIKTIRGLVGENGLYPSRSELIRVAIRDFLIKELHVAKNFFPGFNESPNTEIDKLANEPEKKGFVRVPIIEKKDGMQTITAFKTYKIISR